MNYSRMCQFLATTVAANGEPVQWQQTVSTTDGDKPWNGVAGTSNATTIQLMFVRAGSGALAALLHFATKGTDVPAHAVRALMPVVSGFEPSLTDVITRSDGDVFVVDSIDTIGPSTNAIGYILTFNREGQ